MSIDDILEDLRTGADHNRSISNVSKRTNQVIYLKLLEGTTQTFTFEKMLVAKEKFVFDPETSFEWQKKYNDKYLDEIIFSNGDEENKVYYNLSKPRENQVIEQFTEKLDQDKGIVQFERAEDETHKIIIATAPYEVTVGKEAKDYGQYYIVN